MLDLRHRADEVIAAVRQGRELVLTYRGKPALKLVPLPRVAVGEDDPFYQLANFADEDGESLTNEQIDRAVYGT